jgi:large subunit ribosomal protein L9
MQVILLDRISNLGQLGEVVRVRDGYARNFLIPKGLAKRATQGAIAEFKKRREEIEKVAEEKIKKAQELGDFVRGKTVEIFQKAGIDGRLFGSVTNQDIAEKLSTKKFDILKSQVLLPDGPLKTVGDYPIKFSPHSEIIVELTVKVIPEVSDQ